MGVDQATHFLCKENPTGTQNTCRNKETNPSANQW